MARRLGPPLASLLLPPLRDERHEGGERGRRLATARVVQKRSGKRRAPVVEHADQSSVKNADQLEGNAEIVRMKYSILHESGVLDLAFLRFGILLLSDS